MWNKSRNFAIKIKLTGQNEQTRRNETNNIVRYNIHRAHDHLHTAETIIHACYPWRITNVVGKSCILYKFPNPGN